MTVNVEIKFSFFPTAQRSLAWVNKIGEEWTTLYSPEDCRTRLNDYWYKTVKNYSYDWRVQNPVGVVPDEECTAIFFYGRFLTNVKKNIKKLNTLEEEHGIIPTTYIVTNKGIIFIGDKIWQSALWKITLFSFYLKSLTYSKWVDGPEMEYYPILKPYETTLLQKVVSEKKEILHSTQFCDVHLYSGFVTICQGYHNPTMTKLLLGGVK